MAQKLNYERYIDNKPIDEKMMKIISVVGITVSLLSFPMFFVANSFILKILSVLFLLIGIRAYLEKELYFVNQKKDAIEKAELLHNQEIRDNKKAP